MDVAQVEVEEGALLRYETGDPDRFPLPLRLQELVPTPLRSIRGRGEEQEEDT